jgi:hypothetical protein
MLTDFGNNHDTDLIGRKQGSLMKYNLQYPILNVVIPSAGFTNILLHAISSCDCRPVGISTKRLFYGMEY